MEKERCLKGCLKENKRAFNKNRCHSKLDLESSTLVVSQRQQPAWKTLNQVQGDTFSLMGFTLIELLVVVLIIGILAAVALPEYNLAVAKTRVNRLLPLMADIKQAQTAYYLANGSWSTKFSVLDVDMPADFVSARSSDSYLWYADWGCMLEAQQMTCWALNTATRLVLSYSGNALTCQATASTGSTLDFGKKLCKALCKKELSNNACVIYKN